MKRFIRLIIFLLIVILLVIFIFNRINKKNNIDEESLNDKVKFVLKNEVYYLNNDYGSDIYSTEYRDIISKKINELKEKDDNLIIYNAFGINELSVNAYLKEDKDNYISYTISVDDEKIDDYSNTLKKNENHEYQITGLVPGYVNNIKIIVFDEDDNTKSKTNYEVDLTALKGYSSKLDVYEGKDFDNSEGLFTLLGKDNIYLYDNKGIIRGNIKLDKFSPSDILFKDNYIYYPINKNNFVKVNNLGEVKDIYNTKFSIGNDYILNDNKILYIGSDNNYESHNDQVISLNLDNHEETKLIDGTKLFSKTNLNFNSIDFVGKDILLSSKDMSSIIRINTEDNKIKYILGNKKLWKDDYHKYIYSYDDKLFFGQSEISIKDNTITLLNNNYVSKTIYDNNKKVYDEFDSVNTSKKNGTKSLFYKLKINDKDKSYKLEDDQVLPFTSTNGSIKKYKDNYIFNSSTNNTFIEYNSKFDIINSYKYGFKVNKVYKYSYKNYWFK